jgi:ABC-type glycerol-3-phosphate transport system permease component
MTQMAKRLPRQSVEPVQGRAAGRNRGTYLVYRVLLYLAVAAGGLIFALPFYWMIRTSLMPAWQIYIFPPEWIPAEIHLENFQAPFEVFPYGRWFLNSFVVAGLSTLGVVISSSMVAFSFARLRTPFRDTIFVIVLATMMLPGTVRLIPTYLLFAKLGWVNTFMPLIVPKWLAPAFFVFLLRQFFMSIPKEMDEAALIDGCNPVGLFLRIHLPLSMPALGVAAIFEFTGDWNDFMTPLIYLQGVKRFTVAVGLRLFQGQLTTNMQDLMAASLLAVLPTILLFFLAQRYFVQGIVVSGVKG